MTDASEMTVFEIVSRCGKVIFADDDVGLVMTWNGSLTFQVLQQADRGRFYCVDAWTVSTAPRSLDDAVEECRERLALIKADMDG